MRRGADRRQPVVQQGFQRAGRHRAADAPQHETHREPGEAGQHGPQRVPGRLAHARPTTDHFRENRSANAPNGTSATTATVDQIANSAETSASDNPVDTNSSAYSG